MAEIKHVELLAPAGSYEAFKAGLSAGADAFYLGAERFGARAYADNFTEELIFKALDEAHVLGKRIYLTVNTLFKESELEELYLMLLPLYRHGLDAVIVQDFGAFNLIKSCFKGLPIHASTQMTVTGADGAKFIETCGASRVVPARELSLDEIKSIRTETSLEIECFVHGALCYCYSGACLMSSFIGGRSGNRGKCAQPCRLPYKVYDEERLVSDQNNAYAMNTKDICLIHDIPRLVDAGIDSFKIEGRMKRPEYVAGVVSVYRKYLDIYESGDIKKVSNDDEKLLHSLFNRDGFSRGYFFGDGSPKMMALKNERMSGKRASDADEAYKYVRESIVGTAVKKKVDAFLEISDKRDVSFTVTDGEIYAVSHIDEVDIAKNQPLTKEYALKQLNKTGDTAFEFDAIDIQINADVFLSTKQINSLRRDALDKFQDALTKKYRREDEQANKPDFLIKSKNVPSNTIEINISVSNKAQLDIALNNKQINRVFAPLTLIRKLSDDEKCQYGERLAVMLPYISRHSSNKMLCTEILKEAKSGRYFLVRNLEDAGFLIKNGFASLIKTDGVLYTMNAMSLDFWRKRGVCEHTAPFELNRRELSLRNNSRSELVVYGYVPLMVSAQCVIKNYIGCKQANGNVSIKDRKNVSFPIETDCENCQSITYNSVPLSLLSEAAEVKRLGFKSVRLALTIENTIEAEEIIKKAVRAFKHGDEIKEDFSFTKGHFRRGVE